MYCPLGARWLTYVEVRERPKRYGKQTRDCVVAQSNLEYQLRKRVHSRALASDRQRCKRQRPVESPSDGDSGKHQQRPDDTESTGK